MYEKERIVVICGTFDPLTIEELNYIYSKVDLNISLSKEETFGYTVIETGLMGTPSVCFVGTAQSELITDGASGYLINNLEEFLDIKIPLSDLPDRSDSWEREVNDLAADDSEIADYVKALEESKDAAELPDVSGDTIAKEFERYLRRQQED
jgi:glycosyltransferase involved in cell wall biosynthesis